jgi:hypothetical protein
MEFDTRLGGPIATRAQSIAGDEGMATCLTAVVAYRQAPTHKGGLRILL